MAKRQDIRERHRKRKQQQRLTTILIVAGAALILAAILMMPTIRAAVTPVGEFNQPELKTRPNANANTAGDPNAPVKIKEFSDFGCGHCANFASSTGEIIFDTYVATGLVYIEYNSVGSMLGHPNSITTIEAAYCAGDQNKFWEFHDLIYANQPDLFANINKKIDKTLEAYADALGLDLEQYNNCIRGGKFEDVIQEDFAEAVQAGANSTPSFLINDQLIIGNRPFEEFQAIIEEELTK